MITGAADEEMFMTEFEDVPRVIIFSSKDLEREITKIRETCADPSIHWEKRTEALKRLRSVLVAGAHESDEFIGYLKPLELAFQVSVKDLRSKVVREACITIAYLSQRLGIKCSRFAEALLPTLINLIQNSVKIMSSSAVVAIRFIIQSTHASRLIPIVTYNISSKSKEIRKSCCEFLEQLLLTWPTQALEKHVGILQEAIKKGISDADPEARHYSRMAFWGFAEKFKKEANYLLSSLDSNKQRLLHGEHNNIWNWNSTNSVNKGTQKRPQSIRSNSVSSNGSVENLSRQTNNSLKFRSGIPIFSPRNEPSARMAMPSPFRTTSAIDPGAQRRAKARAAYSAALVQSKVVPNNSNNYSVPRTTTPRRPDFTPLASPERSRSKCRVSRSQPGSRSASPSRFYYSSFNSNPMQTDGMPRGGRVRRKSGIPVATSREPSPNRMSGGITGLTRENSAYFNTVLIGLRSNTKDVESEKECLDHLIELIREGTPEEWALRFKEVYRILLDKITEDNNSAIRAMSLRVMCELLMKRTKYFPEYIELTILRILESSKDSEKEVVRAAEGAAGTAAAVLPPEQCLKILKSVIKTGESPMNIAAIKMLTKLIDLQPKHIVMELLPEMMPALLQAYDNPESAVRKEAVFCMVAIHGVIGEAMNPYLSSLNGSKMKLLKLYIERAKSQSGANSPLLATTS